VSVSCLYEGRIRHRRTEPSREFSHRIAFAYLDLNELPGLLGGRLLRARPGLLRFRRRDYLGAPDIPLAQAVRDLVQERTGHRPPGPVRLLTQLRSFGVCFNPVSFYYCMDDAGRGVQAVVAEVTNTPWGERHAYVIESDASGPELLEGEFSKALHVSPFMGMDHRYVTRLSQPGESLSVHIESSRGERAMFDATLALTRRPLTRGAAASMTARYPMACARVLVLIYAHALGLALARAPVHRHPRTVKT
jgi:DUF1365 family protein